MPRYSRYNSVVSRDTSYTTEAPSQVPSWIDDFANQIEKESAKPKAQSYSIYDQINSILGNKSRYSSVDEAVEDMKKRTGLSSYLDQIKQAQTMTESIFSKIPEAKVFIDNYIEAHPGTSIDAVIHDLLKLNSVKEHTPQSDDVPEEIKRYINSKLAEAERNSSNQLKENLQLGKVDLKTDKNTVRDNDPFASCMPARDGT